MKLPFNRIFPVNPSNFVCLSSYEFNLLTQAHNAGYFDTPKLISSEDMALKLGIPKSTFARKTRTIMKKLLDTSLKDNGF